MSIHIRIFGQLAVLKGKNELTINQLTDTDQLRKNFQDLYPALKNISYLVAVDKKITRENMVLEPDATVAVLPLFSGV